MSKTPTRIPSLCNSTGTRIGWSNLQPIISSVKISHKRKTGQKNRIMIVVDSTRESRAALQWALSHSVQIKDTLVLVHVRKEFDGDDFSKMEIHLRAYQLLRSLRNMCLMTRPGVQVEFTLLEGKETGPIIVEEARRQRVSLLILGQKKRPMLLWQMLRTWFGKARCHSAVDYCIQNAKCLTIAVRRKGNKLGGYLITTKQHKNFWLLA